MNVSAHADQSFFCFNRKDWVKVKDLDVATDTVYSIIKGPLPIQSCTQVSTDLLKIKVPIHRISVNQYENYFITEDLILVHNFVPAAIPLGYIIAAHALDLAATAAIALISAYAAEKATGAISHYTEKLFNPANYKADGSTTSKVSTPNNLPEGTPPPKNNGPDLSKVPPVAAAAEEARKNGGSLVKAVSDGVGKTATYVKNLVPEEVYCEVNGFKFSKYYYEKLWNTGRGAPSLVAGEVLEGGMSTAIPDTIKQGFYKYVYGGVGDGIQPKYKRSLAFTTNTIER